MKTRVLLFAGWIACSGSALWSQRPVQFGVSVHASLPVGDLNTDLDGKMGAGLSFLIPMELGAGQVIRPRIDFNGYSIKDYRRYSDRYRESVTFTSIGMAADYLFYPSGNTNRGVYFGLGLGFQRWGLNHTTYDDDHHYHDTDSETTYNRTSPSFAACIGVQATRWLAMEARFTTAQYYGQQGVLLGDELTTRQVTRNGSSVQMGLVFKW